ncbi:PREDICTED: microtubule-associated protein Jupiter [Ceratosolen solmsi marchali]|uniref:Microtubule-associated protein Jupiter n=1 Tax=Ceratosolen solmsi marchali TaxID=326594 RepID=A0AAJ7DVZ6_9HYME|nr:PREDICTED: microtubule-associated protein Jupiter [Ceratosolen solmsi marchali]
MATYAAYRHVELDNVGYGKKRVLKPPGGGSSDIFGSGNEVDSPRRVKQNYNRSQLGSNFFGDQQQQPSSNGSSEVETLRRKSGKDSHARLFGPHGDPTPNPKNHMRSNISFNYTGVQPNKSADHVDRSNYDYSINGNGVDSEIAFRRSKRFRMSTCMPRNPVTGNGIYVKPHGCRRIVMRKKDGNPVTGTGYEQPTNNLLSAQHNGNGIGHGHGGDTPSIASDKSSTDSSPSAGGVARMKNRVPPGGYSSGLW